MMRDPGLLRPIVELSPACPDAAFHEVWRRYGVVRRVSGPADWTWMIRRSASYATHWRASPSQARSG